MPRCTSTRARKSGSSNDILSRAASCCSGSESACEWVISSSFRRGCSGSISRARLIDVSYAASSSKRDAAMARCTKAGTGSSVRSSALVQALRLASQSPWCSANRPKAIQHLSEAARSQSSGLSISFRIVSRLAPSPMRSCSWASSLASCSPSFLRAFCGQSGAQSVVSRVTFSRAWSASPRR